MYIIMYVDKQIYVHTSICTLIYIRTPLLRDARTNARIRAATSSAPKLLGGTSSNRSCSLRTSMHIYTHICIHTFILLYVYVSVYDRIVYIYLHLTHMYSLKHTHTQNSSAPEL